MSEVLSGSHLCGYQVGYPIVSVDCATISGNCAVVSGNCAIIYGDCAITAGDTLPLFWRFDEMSNMIVHCISIYRCLQNLVP